MYEDFFLQKWIEPASLEERVKEIHKSGKTIVTLNGSFDLLHAGHLHILYEASLQAEILIVALNTDSSIQAYKSPLRPVIDLENRAKMIAALGFVSYVTSFAELDPRAILEKIKPDVHVNGKEYGKNCIESEVVHRIGARLHLVELVPGLSTSAILQKITSLQTGTQSCV